MEFFSNNIGAAYENSGHHNDKRDRNRGKSVHTICISLHLSLGPIVTRQIVDVQFVKQGVLVVHVISFQVFIVPVSYFGDAAF